MDLVGPQSEREIGLALLRSEMTSWSWSKKSSSSLIGTVPSPTWWVPRSACRAQRAALRVLRLRFRGWGVEVVGLAVGGWRLVLIGVGGLVVGG